MILKTLPRNILLCLSTVEIHSLAVWPRLNIRPRLLSNSDFSCFNLSSAGITGTSHHAQCHRRCLQTHQGMPDSWTASPHKGENTFGGLTAIKKEGFFGKW